MSYSDQHLDEAARILQQLDRTAIEKMVRLLVAVPSRGGRLFALVGAGLVIAALGLLDDLRPLAWRPKLIVQFCVAGALVAAGLGGTLGAVVGTLAVAAATINVVGGYLVTARMLQMFKRKR